MAIQDELPKSRITLTYRTTINGEPETVKLPLRLLILGDFSHNTSVDRRRKILAPVQKKDAQGKPVVGADGKPEYVQEVDAQGKPVVGADGKPVYKMEQAYGDDVDLEARRTRSVTGNNLNSVIKDMGISLTLKDGVKNWIDPGKGGESTEVTLPISSMKSFHPDEIVKNVPKLSALLLLRKLLEEMQSNIDNRKELRKSIYSLFTNETERKAILEEFKTYNSMQLSAINTKPTAGG